MSKLQFRCAVSWTITTQRYRGSVTVKNVYGKTREDVDEQTKIAVRKATIRKRGR